MILLTGSTGFIGRNIKEKIGLPLLTPTHVELDLTDAQMVKDYLRANKPKQIIHCASNDKAVCLYDNLRMFHNLAESGIPMISFCTGREIEDRSYKNGEYVLSKYITKELALNQYKHISVIQIWGCFGMYEKDIRFILKNFQRVKEGHPIIVYENKMFSYVYVNDLVRAIKSIVQSRLCGAHIFYYGKLIRCVAYTLSLLELAQAIKKVTKSRHKILVEYENVFHSYVGHNTLIFGYTVLEKALKEYWGSFNGTRSKNKH